MMNMSASYRGRGGAGVTERANRVTGVTYPARRGLRSSQTMEPQIAPEGRSEARYVAFLETISHLRPSLHRYCARMTGNVMDGEDVAQESLFHAYRKLDQYDDTRPLAPWLFRIAHRRCIDFLRRRGTVDRAEAEVAGDGVTAPVEPVGAALDKAVEHLVLVLPPKERACVLLKDVFDYALEEIAELVDSTVGGVKAALHRGRAKLAEQRPGAVGAAASSSGADAELLRLYVERFNRRDWTALRALISADARLVLADRSQGALAEAPYFSTYERIPRWAMTVAWIDGEPVVVIEEAGVARAPIRLRVEDDRIVEIRDYWYCPWILAAATDVSRDVPRA
jgi:RNA polymerase sigma-70 factor (ECF subfamily)